jgi:nicotinamidase-related amidase
MTVTTLDPKSALIVIDLQKGLAGLVPAGTFDPLVARSRALADAFRARDLPVVLVTADGVAPGRTEAPARMGDLPPGFADVMDGLAAQPSDIRVMKRTWGAFANSDLAQQLKDRGVTQVVVTGVATSAGVESTARQAYEAGFNVTLALDAIADLRPEAHERTVALIFPRLGESGTTDEILALLEKA